MGLNQMNDSQLSEDEACDNKNYDMYTIYGNRVISKTPLNIF